MQRAPDVGAIWGTAFALFLALALGLEGLCRFKGHEPSIADSLGNWCVERRRCRNRISSTMAIAGSSRVQLGFHMETFRSMYPDAMAVMLAINGRHPLAVVKDLCYDMGFSGVLLCSVTAASFEPRALEDQQSHACAFWSRPSWRDIDPMIQRLVEGSVIVAGQSAGLRRVTESLLKTGTWPGPLYLRTLEDRSRLADYSLNDTVTQRYWRVLGRRKSAAKYPAMEYADWASATRETAHWISALRARGGELIFVRYPTTGEYWEVDEAAYPKAQYWDGLGRLSGAHTIHFLDVPSLCDFACPDASHLDAKDAPAFTRSLLDCFAELDLYPQATSDRDTK